MIAGINNSKLIHIGIELIIVCGLFYYTHKRTNAVKTELEEKLQSELDDVKKELAQIKHVIRQMMAAGPSRSPVSAVRHQESEVVAQKTPVVEEVKEVVPPPVQKHTSPVPPPAPKITANPGPIHVTGSIMDAPLPASDTSKMLPPIDTEVSLEDEIAEELRELEASRCENGVCKLKSDSDSDDDSDL